MVAINPWGIFHKGKDGSPSAQRCGVVAINTATTMLEKQRFRPLRDAEWSRSLAIAVDRRQMVSVRSEMRSGRDATPSQTGVKLCVFDHISMNACRATFHCAIFSDIDGNCNGFLVSSPRRSARRRWHAGFARTRFAFLPRDVCGTALAGLGAGARQQRSGGRRRGDHRPFRAVRQGRD